MDTKDSGSTNTKTTSSAERAGTSNTTNVPNAPNSNIVEGSAGGTDVRTIDMSGTNLPDATNAKTAEQRASDVRLVDGTTKDASAPATSNAPNAPKTDANGNNIPADSNLTTKTSAPKVPTVQVRLFGSHTHEGIEYEKGDIIDVDESSAKYIVETSEAGARV